MKIELKKPLMHKGNEVRTLNIPLEDLTGNDLIGVEEEIIRSGNMGVVTDFSRVYLISVAAKAAHMPVEILRQMCASDFTEVTTRVRIFLMGLDSGENEEAEIPETLPATFSDESQSG